MSTVTQITVVSEPAATPVRSRTQRLRGSDGRRAITTVSTLTYADEVAAVADVSNVEPLWPLQLVGVGA